MAKTELKKEAVKLRKEGLSYGEILDKVPVSKSTLSRWLRDVGLAERQEQRLTKKRELAQKKAVEARRQQRIERTKKIKKKARNDIDEISKRDLWILGIVLYWAEGAKERVHDGKTNSSLTKFGNSDPDMIKIFLKWLLEACEVPRDEICFRILLHENSKDRKKEVQEYWSEVTDFDLSKFDRITWKEHKPNTNRKKVGSDYYGLLEVKVRKSTDFTRKIAGWIEGIVDKCGVV